MSLACKIFPCRICHIERIGKCSGLLLTRFANKKIYVYVWIPCPGNFYAKFAIEQKMFSRILLQHCPKKNKNQIIFHFMLNFSLEKKTIDQIVFNKTKAGCHGLLVVWNNKHVLQHVLWKKKCSWYCRMPLAPSHFCWSKWFNWTHKPWNVVAFCLGVGVGKETDEIQQNIKTCLTLQKNKSGALTMIILDLSHNSTKSPLHDHDSQHVGKKQWCCDSKKEK